MSKRPFALISCLILSGCFHPKSVVSGCELFKPIYSEGFEAKELAKMGVSIQIKTHNKKWEQFCR